MSDDFFSIQETAPDPNNPAVYLSQARVYIAGILMPTISVTIVSAFDSVPKAEIVLPAYAELLYLGEMDRVPVHVFVQETMVEAGNFILMFEGFIAETSYINNATQRSIVLSAISVFDILNDVQVKFLTRLDEMYHPVLPGAEGLKTFIINSGLAFPAYLLYYGLSGGNGLAEKDRIRFPSDYLANIYAFMQKAGDSDAGYRPPLGNAHSSVLSTYFRHQAEMLHFLDRFERLPYFDEAGADGGYAWTLAGFAGSEAGMATVFPMLYGMQIESALATLTEAANTACEDQSMMELLKFLVEEMEYEFICITNPAYHGYVTEHAVTGNYYAELPEALKLIKRRGMRVNTGVHAVSDKTPKIVSTCLKPLLNDAQPPFCNIMFRSLVDSISLHTVHKGVPTRVQVTGTYSQIAKLSGHSVPAAWTMYGLIDYYPSKIYSKFEVNPANIKYKHIGMEQLPSEEFTGPWVKQLGTPRWFHYLRPEYYNADPVIHNQNFDASTARAFKERFARRQLLNSKYFERQLEASTLFDPYVTPGFPGVVMDSHNASFAFAGHVTTVEHHISPEEMSTRVFLNFVRPLYEAATVTIPNPIDAIGKTTQDSDRLTEIYQALLGTPEMPVPGAVVCTYKELTHYLLNPPPSSVNDVNTNSRLAYDVKRRNIVTFEQYCDFMDLGIKVGKGPEGLATPRELTGEYIEKRMPIDAFALTKNGQHEDVTETIADKYMPKSEEVAAVQGTAPNVIDRAFGQARTVVTVNVRDLLRKVADIEFSRMVYKS